MRQGGIEGSIVDRGSLEPTDGRRERWRGGASTGSGAGIVSSRGQPRPRSGTGRRGPLVASRTGAIPLSPNSRRVERCVTSTAIPWVTKPSSNAIALLTDKPSIAARLVAEVSGVAASTSIACPACEVRRRPAAWRRAASHFRSSRRKISR